MEEYKIVDESINNLIVKHTSTRPVKWVNALDGTPVFMSDTELKSQLRMVFTYHVDNKLIVTPRFVKVAEAIDNIHAETPWEEEQAIEGAFLKDAPTNEPDEDGYFKLNVAFHGVHTEDDLLWAGLNEIIRMYSARKQTPPNGKAVLRLYDGLGNFLEEWVMHEAIPVSLDMTDMNYDSVELDIHLGLKYKRHTFRCGVIS